MKVAIDISQIIYGTGVSVYTKNLVQNLIKLFPHDEYVLFGGSLRRRNELKEIATKLGGKEKIYSLPPSILDLVWNSFHILPIEKLVGSIDIIHTSDWTEPPSLIPKVTTVHDLIPFIYPKTSADVIKTAHRKKMSWVIKESQKIISVSQATKNDLIELFRIPSEKIEVVYEGVDSRYMPQPPAIIETIKNRYHIDGDYLFCLSTLEPRKNQDKIIKAYKQIKNKYSGLKLVIGGKTGWGNSIEPIDGVIMAGYIPDADLPPLYSGSLAFVLPSLYEGFGLPHLEAMASGAPVIGSSVSSMPEVIGEAGVLVDPNSIDEIVTGIIQAVEDRPRLIDLGLKQAKKFTWEKCAQRTHQVYQQVLSDSLNK